MIEAGFVFRLFDQKFVVSGRLHENIPVLIGKKAGVTVLIGKSPNGRLILAATDWVNIEGLATMIFSELQTIDDFVIS